MKAIEHAPIGAASMMMGIRPVPDSFFEYVAIEILPSFLKKFSICERILLFIFLQGHRERIYRKEKSLI